MFHSAYIKILFRIDLQLIINHQRAKYTLAFTEETTEVDKTLSNLSKVKHFINTRPEFKFRFI